MKRGIPLSSQARHAQEVPGELLLSPPVLFCAALLGLNDHLFKATYHNWLTGKLSDFAGLVVLPCVLLATWEWARFVFEVIREELRSRGGERAWSASEAPNAPRWRASSGTVLLVCGAIGLAFSALNLSASASDLYCTAIRALSVMFRGTPLELGLPRNVVDPTDLMALPAALVPFLLARRGGLSERRNPARSSPPSSTPRTSLGAILHFRRPWDRWGRGC